GAEGRRSAGHDEVLQCTPIRIEARGIRYEAIAEPEVVSVFVRRPERVRGPGGSRSFPALGMTQERDDDKNRKRATSHPTPEWRARARRAGQPTPGSESLRTNLAAADPDRRDSRRGA